MQDSLPDWQGHQPSAKQGNEERVGEQDQALDRGGEVLQALQVEVARYPVAQYTNPCGCDDLAQRQGSVRRLTRPDDSVHRQCDRHSDGQQSFGIAACRIGHLHDDALRRQQQRADDSEGEPGDPVISHGRHPPCLRLS